MKENAMPDMYIANEESLPERMKAEGIRRVLDILESCGLTLEDIEQARPALRRPATPAPWGPPVLRLPNGASVDPRDVQTIQPDEAPARVLIGCVSGVRFVLKCSTIDEATALAVRLGDAVNRLRGQRPPETSTNPGESP
jgi:hypothetical protein